MLCPPAHPAGVGWSWAVAASFGDAHCSVQQLSHLPKHSALRATGTWAPQCSSHLSRLVAPAALSLALGSAQRPEGWVRLQLSLDRGQRRMRHGGGPHNLAGLVVSPNAWWPAGKEELTDRRGDCAGVECGQRSSGHRGRLPTGEARCHGP